MVVVGAQVGSVVLHVSKRCVTVGLTLFRLPAASLNDAALTDTLISPVEPAGGVTNKVYWVSLTRVSVPMVPPETIRSSAVKLLPTASLKLKVNVTGPLAVPMAPVVMVTVGGKMSGAPASPPPQAASCKLAATATASKFSRGLRVFMFMTPGDG